MTPPSSVSRIPIMTDDEQGTGASVGPGSQAYGPEPATPSQPVGADPSRVYVHIYSPPVTDRSISSGHCGDCKRRTRFAGFFQDWHGWNHTCLRCGRVWDDGEWIALPFIRSARKRNVEAAKQRWRRLRDRDAGSAGDAQRLHSEGAAARPDRDRPQPSEEQKG